MNSEMNSPSGGQNLTNSTTTITRSASECNKWELSTYEKKRAPQEVITDETRMALHPECLRNDFICPICLKLQSNTVTVMGCLHRFCRECIIKALSNTSKECPVCRTRLPNKRYLRADPNFDMLISKIFPLREEEFDDFNNSTSNAANSSSANGTFNNSSTGGRLRPRLSRRSLRSTRLAPDASPDEGLSITAPDGSTTIVSNGLISPKSLAPVESEIEVIFKPLSIDHELGSDNWLNQTRYIKTSPSATVDHLIKYLSLRYKIDSKLAGEEEVNPDESLFRLCVANGPGQFQGLTVDQVMTDIQKVYFKSLPDKPIELYFAYNIGSTDELTAEGDSM